MKKCIVSLFLSLTLLTFTVACGSSAPQETPDSSGEPVSSSQPETSPTPAPTPSPTPTPSPEPTPTPDDSKSDATACTEQLGRIEAKLDKLLGLVNPALLEG